MHHPAGQTTCRHPFVDRIMEADIPLGWKSLNLELYDGTTDSDEHLDAFVTQANLYSNVDVIFRSHRMALASLWQADDESLRKFMDKFGRIVVQIRNLNPEVALQSMLLTL
ncbi:hypothetical protein JHK82_050192 [Glycine max]|nr:hypothetical protein JHK82_050192 [Glycine max]